MKLIPVYTIHETLKVHGGYVLENPANGKTALREVKTLREKWDWGNRTLT
jgi:hypothetical protein